MNLTELRQQFPALMQQVDGQSPIFLMVQVERRFRSLF